MKKSLFSYLCFMLAVCSAIVEAQEVYDSFDPELVCVSRSIWDDQLTSEAKNCIQNSFKSNRPFYIAFGVHLENIDVDWKDSEFESVNLIMKPLLSAKQSNDPDSFLLAYIPFETIRDRPETNHRFVYADEFLSEILFIRLIKRIRAGEHVIYERYATMMSYLPDGQKEMLESASCSTEEWMEKFRELAGKPSSVSRLGTAALWRLDTYRARFIDFFSTYYDRDRFNAMPEDAQGIVLYYWNRNSDLLSEADRYDILHLLRDPKVNPWRDRLNFQKILLRCILRNCSREEYMKEIDLFADKKAEARYMEKIRKQTEKEYPEMCKKPEVKQPDLPKVYRKSFYRPEELVTMFDQSKPDELLAYFQTNFNLELYQPGKFYSNPVVINLRAALQKLGNMDKNLPAAQDKQITMIVHQLMDMGITPCENCWTEAYNLIIGLGKYAVPTLQEEYFNTNKARVQFATQILNDLKDREIVQWMIRVVEKTDDEQVKTWSLGWLRIMREYRSPNIEHRGVSQEESEAIAREIIDPFLGKMGYPIKG